MIWPNNNLDAVYENICEKALASSCSVLMLVACEPDAICAAKLFCKLLKADKISYKIIGIEDENQLLRELDSLTNEEDDIKSVVLFNCGGDIDLGSMLDEELIFYVIDSRRPFNHKNVLPENSKVILFGAMEDTSENIKEKAIQAFRIENMGDIDASQINMDGPDDDSEEEEFEFSMDKEDSQGGNEDQENMDPNNSKADRGKVTKKKKKILKKKVAVVDPVSSYYAGRYVSEPASHTLLSLIQSMNRSTSETIWLGIVGSTSRMIRGFISESDFNVYLAEYQELVKFRNYDDDTQDTFSSSSLRIKFSTEYRLFLYRETSLYEGFLNSQYTSGRLSLSTESWTKGRGRKRMKSGGGGVVRLNTMLARMGISIDKAKERYKYLDLTTKRLFDSGISSVKEEFSINDLCFGSFVRETGRGIESSSVDDARVIEGAISILSSSFYQDEDFSSGFNVAMDLLNGDYLIPSKLQHECMKSVLEIQSTIMSCAWQILHRNLVKSAGDFRYSILEDFTNEQAAVLTNDILLKKLADTVIELSTSQGKWLGINFKPLVVCLPDSENDQTWIFAASESPKPGSRVHREVYQDAFRETVDVLECEHNILSFDAALVECKGVEAQDFLAALHDTLIRR